MSSNKGIDYLIVAFAILKKRYKHLKLILKDQSNLYGISGRDIFLKTKKGINGHLLGKDVENEIIFLSKNMTISILNDLYNISDCYVSPYRAEGFNLGPLEAAATGTPIIVTEGGSTDDYFNEDFGLQIKSKFINSNNRKYLEPSLESLVENTSLIIQNPRNPRTSDQKEDTQRKTDHFKTRRRSFLFQQDQLLSKERWLFNA